jgi:hypothetical protein
MSLGPCSALSIAALVLTCWTFGACTSHPNSGGAANDGSDHPSAKPVAVVKPKPTLVESGKAYLRIKEYQAKADRSATPKGATTTFVFGDAVTLVKKKKDGLPAFWLASKGPDDQPVLIPGYLLTPSQGEINSPRSKDRIPQTMSFYILAKMVSVASVDFENK